MHDTHSNGKITHELYAELEGTPEPADWGLKSVGSSSSLFGMRKSGKRSPSAAASGSTSRATSPSRSGRHRHSLAPSNVPSGASTPIGGGAPAAPLALAGALANLNLNNGHASPTVHSGVTSGSGSGSATPHPGYPGSQQPINPAHLAAEYSFTVTRQEVPYLPRTPSYEDTNYTDTATQTPWVIGTHRQKRHIMLVYNPNPSGGTNELHDRANGFVPGLGVWEMTMVSDVVRVLRFRNSIGKLTISGRSARS